MSTLWHDLRFALRTLRQNRGFTLVMVLTLALGIGANTAIFSVIYGVLLRPLPYQNDQQLVRLRHQAPLADIDDGGVSVPELAEYRERSRSFTDLVEYHSLWFNLLSEGEPERVQSGVVSWNFFDVLGVRPVLGRTFLPEEDRVGAEPVLVLSHSFWERKFGRDPGVVGKQVEMNDHLHTIVGVLPPIPQYPDDNDVWMPWYACPFRSGDHWQHHRDLRALTVLGRLREGVRPEQAERDLAAVSRVMQAEHPAEYPATGDFRASLISVHEDLTENARTPLLVLMAVAAFVLLIACANVSSLALARIASREQELAVRSALGAGRGRLVRQLLTESTLLALLGGVVGLGIGYVMLDLLVRFAADFTPRADEIRISGSVLAYTLLVSAATGLAVGSLPALFFARNVGTPLREGGGHATAGVRRLRLRGALVVTQLAVAFMLLIGAGLMIRSFVKLQQVRPGFDATNVLTARVDLDWTSYTDPQRQRTFYAALLERVNAIPGVLSAALAGNVPLDGGLPSTRVRIEGRELSEGELAPQTDFQVVSAGYFETLRVPLLLGRTFSLQDHAEAPPVAVISQSLARRFWGSRDPVGERISGDGENWVTIVGVVGDVRHEELDRESDHVVYVPLGQASSLGASILVRTRTPPVSLAPQIVAAVRQIDPRQPVAFVRTLEQVRSESLAEPRLTTSLLGLFAGLALAIAIAGIVGLIAYSVSQRTHEIGIRMALGARGENVLWMMLRQGLTLVLVGLAIGAAGAVALTRLLAGLLYRVEPTDPLTFVTVALALLAATAIAVYVPARRATGISPLAALRSQ